MRGQNITILNGEVPVGKNSFTLSVEER